MIRRLLAATSEQYREEAPLGRPPEPAPRDAKRSGPPRPVGASTEETPRRPIPSPVDAPTETPDGRDAIVATLTSRSQLRQAVLAREILGPPTALREAGPPGRWERN